MLFYIIVHAASDSVQEVIIPMKFGSSTSHQRQRYPYHYLLVIHCSGTEESTNVHRRYMVGEVSIGSNSASADELPAYQSASPMHFGSIAPCSHWYCELVDDIAREISMAMYHESRQVRGEYSERHSVCEVVGPMTQDSASRFPKTS